MKSILVTGSDGQLGSSLKKNAGNYPMYTFTWIDINDLDLTVEDKVTHFFKKNHFDYIINCAAFTAVDKAEEQPDKAFAVNYLVPDYLGNICTTTNSRIIHISTDYIYDGSRNQPHLEEDLPLPVSVYAKSKLEGEKALWSNRNAIIIRTSWLYSEFGNNFLRTMIRLALERKELGVVYDQTGTPTYAGDLALAVLNIIDHSEKNKFVHGIYNYSNEGVCSWFDFATEIMKITGSSCSIKPIRTHEYPLPAKRPEYSVLDKSKIKRNFEIQIPFWRNSLKIAIDHLNKKPD